MAFAGRNVLEKLLRHNKQSLMDYTFGELGQYIKSKAVSLQAWSRPEGSWKLRFPDFMSVAHDDGKVVSLRHRQPLLPGNAPGTHFC